MEHLCAFLLDGDDGAPLQAHQSSTSQRPEPALSCAEAPPAPLHRQCSPPAAQPRTPFCAINPAPWPVHVSPFALDTCPAPVFTVPPPRSACGSPPLPERTGDSALSWVALWCARAEAEGIDCLPPPSLSSWQELVAVGSLSGSLSQSNQSLPPTLPPPAPVHGTVRARASSTPASCHHCCRAGDDTHAQTKRRRMAAGQRSVRWSAPECYI